MGIHLNLGCALYDSLCTGVYIRILLGFYWEVLWGDYAKRFCKTIPKTTADWCKVLVLGSVSRTARGRFRACFWSVLGAFLLIGYSRELLPVALVPPFGSLLRA